MYEAFRVLKRFGWGGGWVFAPRDGCNCQTPIMKQVRQDGQVTEVMQNNACPGCTHEVGSGCVCERYSCHCPCGVPAWRYGGDILIMLAGHPRKTMMLADFSRKCVGDAGLPPVDELLKEEKFKRLLSPPVQGRREKVRV